MKSYSITYSPTASKYTVPPLKNVNNIKITFVLNGIKYSKVPSLRSMRAAPLIYSVRFKPAVCHNSLPASSIAMAKYLREHCLVDYIIGKSDNKNYMVG